MTDYNFDNPQDIAQQINQQVMLQSFQNETLYGDQRMDKMTAPSWPVIILALVAGFSMLSAPFVFAFIVIHFKWFV